MPSRQVTHLLTSRSIRFHHRILMPHSRKLAIRLERLGRLIVARIQMVFLVYARNSTGSSEVSPLLFEEKKNSQRC